MLKFKKNGYIYVKLKLQHCAGYEHTTDSNGDDAYRCLCQDNAKPSNHIGDGNPEKLWYWNVTTNDWTADSKTNGYRCEELKSWEDSSCLSWTKDSDMISDTYPLNHCEGCRYNNAEMYLRLDNKCIKKDLDIDSRDFPTNCYSGKEKTVLGVDIIECLYCNPGFYMYEVDGVQKCQENTLGTADIDFADHCELNMMNTGTGLKRCFQCAANYLLHKATVPT